MRASGRARTTHVEGRARALPPSPRPECSHLPPSPSPLPLPPSPSTDSVVRIWPTSPLLDESLEGSASLRRPLAALGGTHQAAVHTVRWSTSGALLASGDLDGLVVVWEQRAGRAPPPPALGMSPSDAGSENWGPLSLLKAAGDDVQDVAWSPSDRYLAVARMDGRIHVWRVAGAGAGQQRQGKGAARGAKGGRGGDAGNRLQTRPFLELNGHSGWAQGVAWDPFGRYVASAGNDRTICLWKAGSGDRGADVAPSKAAAGSGGGKPLRKRGRLGASPAAAAAAASSSSSSSSDDIDDEEENDDESGTDNEGRRNAEADDEAAAWAELRSSSAPFRGCESEGDIRRIDWGADGVALVASHAFVAGAFTAPLLARGTLAQGAHLKGHIRPVVAARCSPFLVMRPATEEGGDGLGVGVGDEGGAGAAAAAAVASAGPATFPCYALGSLDGSLSVWRSGRAAAAAPSEGGGAAAGIPADARPLLALHSIFAAPVTDLAWGAAPDAEALGAQRSAAATNPATAAVASAAAATAGAVDDAAGPMPWRDVYAAAAPRSAVPARTPFLLAAGMDGSLVAILFGGNTLGAVATPAAAVAHLAAAYGVASPSLTAPPSLGHALAASERRRRFLQGVGGGGRGQGDLDGESVGGEDEDGDDDPAHASSAAAAVLRVEAADVVLFLARRQVAYGVVAGAGGAGSNLVPALPPPSFVPDVPDAVLKVTAPHLARRISAAAATSRKGRAQSAAAAAAAAALPSKQTETTAAGGRRRIMPVLVPFGGFEPAPPSVAPSAAATSPTSATAAAAVAQSAAVPAMMDVESAAGASAEAPAPIPTRAAPISVQTLSTAQAAGGSAAFASASSSSSSSLFGASSALDLVLSGGVALPAPLLASAPAPGHYSGLGLGLGLGGTDDTAMKQLEARLLREQPGAEMGFGGPSSSSATALPPLLRALPAWARVVDGASAPATKALSWGLSSLRALVRSQRELEERVVERFGGGGRRGDGRHGRRSHSAGGGGASGARAGSKRSRHRRSSSASASHRGFMMMPWGAAWPGWPGAAGAASLGGGSATAPPPPPPSFPFPFAFPPYPFAYPGFPGWDATRAPSAGGATRRVVDGVPVVGGGGKRAEGKGVVGEGGTPGRSGSVQAPSQPQQTAPGGGLVVSPPRPAVSAVGGAQEAPPLLPYPPFQPRVTVGVVDMSAAGGHGEASAAAMAASDPYALMTDGTDAAIGPEEPAHITCDNSAQGGGGEGISSGSGVVMAEAVSSSAALLWRADVGSRATVALAVRVPSSSGSAPTSSGIPDALVALGCADGSVVVLLGSAAGAGAKALPVLKPSSVPVRHLAFRVERAGATSPSSAIHLLAVFCDGRVVQWRLTGAASGGVGAAAAAAAGAAPRYPLRASIVVRTTVVPVLAAGVLLQSVSLSEDLAPSAVVVVRPPTGSPALAGQGSPAGAPSVRPTRVTYTWDADADSWVR